MIVAEVGEAIKMAIIMVIKAIDPEMGDISQITDIMTGPITEGKTFNQDYGQRNRNISVRQTNVRTIINQSFHEG